MAEMITRCPKCDTAFRITPAQLKPAKGSVRCGSCLQVFNAKDNLTDASRAAIAAAQNRKKQRAQTPVQPPPTDDVLISDDMEQNFGEDGNDVIDPEERVLRDHNVKPQTGLFERTHIATDQDETKSSDDETWAQQLLDEDDSKPSGRDAKQDPSTVGEWRDKRPKNTIPETLPSLPLTADRRDAPAYTYLDAIEPEPMEFAYRIHRPFWNKRVLWAILSLVALFVLAGQIAWLQYPAFNRIEPYRSFYSRVCDIIGCQLPVQQNRAEIHTSNLVVRSHPRVEGALMVDVILQNNAPFQQSFPELELTFSDVNGRIMAQRQFTPDEYLGGELTGQRMMPVKQPIHIALEIVDPGRQAVNYQIAVADASHLATF